MEHSVEQNHSKTFDDENISYHEKQFAEQMNNSLQNKGTQIQLNSQNEDTMTTDHTATISLLVNAVVRLYII